MSDHIQIVEDFCRAWSQVDVDKIMSFVASDCFYHNIPMDPVEGADAIRQFITAFIGAATTIEFEVHHIGETAGGVVLTERTDKFEVGDKWIKLPVMGAFEVRDGKIQAWRDYFDVNQYTSQMAD